MTHYLWREKVRLEDHGCVDRLPTPSAYEVARGRRSYLGCQMIVQVELAFGFTWQKQIFIIELLSSHTTYERGPKPTPQPTNENHLLCFDEIYAETRDRCI